MATKCTKLRPVDVLWLETGLAIAERDYSEARQQYDYYQAHSFYFAEAERRRLDFFYQRNIAAQGRKALCFARWLEEARREVTRQDTGSA